MSQTLTSDQLSRRRLLFAAGPLLTLLDQPQGGELLAAEADDPGLGDHEKLISRPGLDHLLRLRADRQRSHSDLGYPGTDDVLIVPGFMGSVLKDAGDASGRLWIDPKLPRNGGQFAALRLATFHTGQPDPDVDPTDRIESVEAVPAIYDVLYADLAFRRYDTAIFAFDWRKDIQGSARLLAARIRARLGRRSRPLHLIAHSQGALVALRAIQILGPGDARKLVQHLVLIGPVSFGTFSAALALSGTHEALAPAEKLGVQFLPNSLGVFQSFTSLYQLLPWNPKLVPEKVDPTKQNPQTADTANEGQLTGASDSAKERPFDVESMKVAANWRKVRIDKRRLRYGFGWSGKVDASFFYDRTAIILGDRPTVGAVRFDGKRLVPLGAPVAGDGMVPDILAKIPGVQRVYRAPGVDHMTLPMDPSVLFAIRAILRGDTPALRPMERAYTVRVPSLQGPIATPIVATAGSPATPHYMPDPPAPPSRRLRVFSFDPLLSTKLDTLEIAWITIDVPWEADGRLGEGPVGEYVEVVDYDPASRCFYAPVDLTHPRLAAQDGLPPSESNPQFHQQMTYAVAMATIATFEKALGRVALWAPHLTRNVDGEVIPTPFESQFVPRLRIYPHALRDANAYYDPDRHALLFGYFPSREQPGGETLPGGTVFACQSFDIIAHETTHALLHGLHRHYLYPSNPDVLAFHEAFADAVALFQHFSHIDVVRHQVAQTRGDLKQENLLGQLARQFGQAMGQHRGALRQYIANVPDPALYTTTTDAHDRGAVLMAALFLAFQKIYTVRSRDLYRIATGGTGRLPDGEIHPDLVNRLAGEAAKSARHLLRMCVRALDYVPPVDLTFGEYVRALITADFDLVRDDDLGYRIAVIDAFRSWGIYPADVNVLDEPALLWDAPQGSARDALRDVVRTLNLADWRPRSDRRSAFLRMAGNAWKLRRWLFKNARETHDDGASLGVKVFGSSWQSIPREESNRALPKFEVVSVRPCLRIGPDGEQQNDLVAEIVQWRAGFFDEKVQDQVDRAKQPWAFTRKERETQSRTLLPTPTNQPDFWFRGGCTLLIDPDSGEIRYCIKKSVRSQERLARQRAFERDGGSSSTAALYFGTRDRNPFALLHSPD